MSRSIVDQVTEGREPCSRGVVRSVTARTSAFPSAGTRIREVAKVRLAASAGASENSRLFPSISRWGELRRPYPSAAPL
jgi:hypothetical protein